MKQKKIKRKLTMLCVYLEKFNQNVLKNLINKNQNVSKNRSAGSWVKRKVLFLKSKNSHSLFL